MKGRGIVFYWAQFPQRWKGCLWKWHRRDRDYRQEQLEKTQWVGAPCVSTQGQVTKRSCRWGRDQAPHWWLCTSASERRARLSVPRAAGTSQQEMQGRGHRKRVETGKRQQQSKELGRKTKEENRGVLEYQKESKTLTKLLGQKFHLCELFVISQLFSSKQIK